MLNSCQISAILAQWEVLIRFWFASVKTYAIKVAKRPHLQIALTYEFIFSLQAILGLKYLILLVTSAWFLRVSEKMGLDRRLRYGTLKNWSKLVLTDMFGLYSAGGVLQAMHVLLVNIHEVQALGGRVPYWALSVRVSGWPSWIRFWWHLRTHFTLKPYINTLLKQSSEFVSPETRS